MCGHVAGNDVAAKLKGKHPELAGTLFEEIGTIVSVACLAQICNPPFGHSGEKAIQTFFTEGNGRHLREILDAEFWTRYHHSRGQCQCFPPVDSPV